MGLGFRTKLTLANSLIVVVFAGFFAIYLPQQQESAAEKALTAHAATLAAVLGAITQPALALGEELGLFV